MPDRDAELWGEDNSDACEGAGIPRERREAPNPHYLPGAGEDFTYFTTPFDPTTNGSP